MPNGKEGRLMAKTTYTPEQIEEACTSVAASQGEATTVEIELVRIIRQLQEENAKLSAYELFAKPTITDLRAEIGQLRHESVELTEIVHAFQET